MHDSFGMTIFGVTLQLFFINLLDDIITNQIVLKPSDF